MSELQPIFDPTEVYCGQTIEEGMETAAVNEEPQKMCCQDACTKQ